MLFYFFEKLVEFNILIMVVKSSLSPPTVKKDMLPEVPTSTSSRDVRSTSIVETTLVP